MENLHYTSIATKIKKTDKEKLTKIANRFGMSFYELLQSLLLALLRYFDEGTLCSEELETMMKAFADVISKGRGSFNLMAMRNYDKMKIKKAIFIVERDLHPELNPQLLEASKDSLNRVTGSYNTDKMLSDFLNAYDPKILKGLEKEKKSLGYFSLGQTLKEVVLHSTPSPQEQISKDVKTLFTDIRINTGQTINTDLHYKRVKRNGMDYSNLIPESRYQRADIPMK